MEQLARDAIVHLQQQPLPHDLMSNTISCISVPGRRWCSLNETEQLGKGKRIFLPQDNDPFVLKIDRRPKTKDMGVQAEHIGLSRLVELLRGNTTRLGKKSHRNCKSAACSEAAARIPFTTPPFQLNFTLPPTHNSSRTHSRARVEPLLAVLQQRVQGALFKAGSRHSKHIDDMWTSAFDQASKAAKQGRAYNAVPQDADHAGAYKDVRSLRVVSLEPPAVQAVVVSELLLWAAALADAHLKILDMQFLVASNGRIWLFDPKGVSVTPDAPNQRRLPPQARCDI
jgi:hypothetical protein